MNPNSANASSLDNVLHIEDYWQEEMVHQPQESIDDGMMLTDQCLRKAKINLFSSISLIKMLKLATDCVGDEIPSDYFDIVVQVAEALGRNTLRAGEELEVVAKIHGLKPPYEALDQFSQELDEDLMGLRGEQLMEM